MNVRSGEVLQHVTLPAPLVTSIAFAGPVLSSLVVGCAATLDGVAAAVFGDSGGANPSLLTIGGRLAEAAVEDAAPLAGMWIAGGGCVLRVDFRGGPSGARGGRLVLAA